MYTLTLTAVVIRCYSLKFCSTAASIDPTNPISQWE